MLHRFDNKAKPVVEDPVRFMDSDASWRALFASLERQWASGKVPDRACFHPDNLLYWAIIKVRPIEDIRRIYALGGVATVWHLKLALEQPSHIPLDNVLWLLQTQNSELQNDDLETLARKLVNNPSLYATADRFFYVLSKARPGLAGHLFLMSLEDSRILQKIVTENWPALLHHYALIGDKRHMINDLKSLVINCIPEHWSTGFENSGNVMRDKIYILAHDLIRRMKNPLEVVDFINDLFVADKKKGFYLSKRDGWLLSMLHDYQWEGAPVSGKWAQLVRAAKVRISQLSELVKKKEEEKILKHFLSNHTEAVWCRLKFFDSVNEAAPDFQVAPLNRLQNLP